MELKDDRVYFGVLKRVGLEGSYQTNFMRILYVISAISGATLNIVPFLFFQDPFDCGQFDNDCTQTVCSLPAGLRSQYLPSKPYIKSLGNHYGDMHCERMEELTKLKELFLIGTSVGVFVSILFVEIVGKKMAVALALFTTIVSLLVLVFLQDIYVKGIALFVWGGCSQIIYTILTPYITEKNAQKNRVSCYAWLQFWYVFGCLLNVSFFYLLRDWKMVMLIYFLTFYAVSAVAFVYYVQSTPLELISNQTPQNAYKAFIRIADRNQITDHGLTLQQIESLQQQYRLLKKKKHDYRFNFLDLLRYPSIRADFLKLGFIFFITLFLAYSHLFMLDQLNVNIFLLSLINVLAQFLAIPIFRLLLIEFPRKTSLTFNFIIMTAALFLTFGLAPNDCLNCKQGWIFVFILIIFFFTRLSINVAANLTQSLINQSFPAQIRSIGVYSVVGVARLSTVVIPYLTRLRDSLHIPLLLQFSCLGVVGILAAAMVRETWKILPQQLIKQLRENEKDSENINM